MISNSTASVLFRENFLANAHIVINQGGSNSGKTYAIIQALFCLACECPKQIITIAGQDIPNLKAGPLRDALNIWSGSAQLMAFVKSYNKSDRIFEFRNETAEYISPDDQ
jgi:phage terminase large subunit